MALANLFAADPALPASQSPGPFRSGVQEVCATKRPNLGGQWAGQKKSMKNTHKQFNQAKKAKTHRPPTFYDYDNPDASPRPANFPHRTFRDSDKERDPFTHSGVHFQHNMHKKVQPRQQIQNTPTFKQDTPQQNVMQKKKKKKKNNNKKQENAQSRSNSGGNGGQWHQAGPRERFPSNGRGPTKMNKDHMQNSSAKRVRPMTQEFKDQNACEVNGRLICKHFLMGRCTKGDECQLPHANAVNNQIKSVCKFYVQGCCGKGENCPYMHRSFPCKYFHARGTCSNEADCRFSHEPLTNVTKQLLDEALQRDKDLMELAKTNKRESLAQPGTADVEVTAEEDTSSPKPDILLHPVRLNFYHSSCPAEPHSAMEEVIGTEQAHEPTHITNTSLPCSPLSSDLKADFKGVSEAALGPMKSKPFPSLFGSSGDPTPVSSPPRSVTRPSVVANQIAAPYSVDAVLGSVKTVVSSYLTHASYPPPSAHHPLSFYGSECSKEVPRKVAQHSGMPMGSNKAKAGLSRSCVVSSTNPDYEHPHRRLPMARILPPDSQSSAEVHGVVLDPNSCTYNQVLPAQPELRQAKDTQKAFHSLFACPLNQNDFKRTPPLRPLPSAAPSNPRHSVRLPDASSASAIGKEKTASTDTATGHHNTQVSARPLEQSAVINVGNPGVPPGPKRQCTESPGCTPQAKTDDGGSKPAHWDHSVLGPRKPMKRPYHSSIASPDMDGNEDLPPLQIATDLITASSVSQEIREVKSGKATAGGVLQSLFATPIPKTTASPPSAQGHLGAFKPRPVEGSSDHHTKHSGALASPPSSPGPKRPNREGHQSQRSAEHSPTVPIQNNGGLPSQMPKMSSDKVPANAATTTSNSVLKTLFLNLRPYHHEEERNIHSRSGDQGKNKTNCRSISKERQKTQEQQKQQQQDKPNEAEKRTREVLRAVEPAVCLVNPDRQVHGSCEPTSQPAAPAEHRPMFLNSQPAQSSVQRRLKSLFKTLDPTASPFGC